MNGSVVTKSVAMTGVVGSVGAAPQVRSVKMVNAHVFQIVRRGRLCAKTTRRFNAAKKALLDVFVGKMSYVLPIKAV